MIRVFSEDSINDDHSHDFVYRFMQENFTVEECLSAVSTRGNTLMDIALYHGDMHALRWFFAHGKTLRPGSVLTLSNEASVEYTHLILTQDVRIYARNQRTKVELIFHGYPPSDVDYEQEAARLAFVSCRSVVVTLLALKRRRIRSMETLDRFLVREFCFAVWITRYVWPPEKENQRKTMRDLFVGSAVALSFACTFPLLLKWLSSNVMM